MTGKMLGRYELLEQLGEGGMGTVWLARLGGAAGFEKLCIVKTVLPSIAKDADFVSRFLHEGRVLTQLTHGNIAQVLDMNEADGQLFLALEYVAGVDLSRLHEQVRARGEFMPTSLVVALVAQAAEGLGAAHRKSALDGTPLHVVHRDVSPQNIMVSYEGEVKVIDFGIAKSEARSRHTAQASVMGKLGYMAPEQARGENVDHRADQYALAIVLWELLSNQSFVRRGTLTEMVVAMAAPTLRPLTPLRPDVPPSLEAVVLKALAPKPDERFADTDAFAQALTGELLLLGPPPTKPQLGEYVKSRCVQEFTTQRQLLSRISTLKGMPTQAPVTADAFSATAVRPVTQPSTMPHPGLAVTIAERPLATPATSPSPLGERVGVRADETVPMGSSAVAPSAASPAAVPASADGTTPMGVSAVAASTAPMGTSAVSGPTTGELTAALAPKRNGALIGAGALVVVLLGGAVAWTFLPKDNTQLREADVAVIDAGAPAVVAIPDAATTPDVVDAGVAALEAPPPPPTDVGPEPEPEPELKVMGRHPPGGPWIISNLGATAWSRCDLIIPGQLVAKLGAVARNASLEVPTSRFRKDPSAPDLKGELQVDCTEGVGTYRLR